MFLTFLLVWLSYCCPSTLISKKYCLQILFLACWCFTCLDRNWRKILSHTLKTLVKNDTNHKGLPWNEKKTIDILMFWFNFFFLHWCWQVQSRDTWFIFSLLFFALPHFKQDICLRRKKKNTSISSWFRPRRWEFFFLGECLGNCFIKGKNSRRTVRRGPASLTSEF